MSESKSHRQAKAKAAGKTGTTEKPLPGKRRLDAATAKRATEVERSGTTQGLKKAAQRLKDSGKLQKVLQVPQQHMGLAAEAMRKVGIGGTLKNMGGTKRRSVCFCRRQYLQKRSQYCLRVDQRAMVCDAVQRLQRHREEYLRAKRYGSKAYRRRGGFRMGPGSTVYGPNPDHWRRNRADWAVQRQVHLCPQGGRIWRC